MDVLENNRRYRNLNPYCEPQLGRRNLYCAPGDTIGTEITARLWVLNLSDGEHSLLDIAERSGIPFPLISDAAESRREEWLAVGRAGDAGERTGPGRSFARRHVATFLSGSPIYSPVRSRLYVSAIVNA